MKRLFYLFALVVAIFTFDATAAFGQASLVRGVVVDAVDGEPVMGATVVIYYRTTDSVIGLTKTDELGVFEVAVNARYYSVEVMMPGYYISTAPIFKPYYYDGNYQTIVNVWLTQMTENYIQRETPYDMLMNYHRQWVNVE